MKGRGYEGRNIGIASEWSSVFGPKEREGIVLQYWITIKHPIWRCRVDDIVLNIDLAPTFLDIAGVETPPQMDGRSFKKLFQKWVYCQFFIPRILHNPGSNPALNENYHWEFEWSIEKYKDSDNFYDILECSNFFKRGACARVAANTGEDRSLSGRTHSWSSLRGVVKPRNRSRNRRRGKRENRIKRHWLNSIRTRHRKRRRTTRLIRIRSTNRSIDSSRTIREAIKIYRRTRISKTRSSMNRVISLFFSLSLSLFDIIIE